MISSSVLVSTIGAHRIEESKGILVVVPNPTNPNLALLYTREEGKQMKLIDLRVLYNTMSFWGWNGRSPESIYLKQEWSLNGLYFTTGCKLNIFDIRCSMFQDSHSTLMDPVINATIGFSKQAGLMRFSVFFQSHMIKLWVSTNSLNQDVSFCLSTL